MNRKSTSGRILRFVALLSATLLAGCAVPQGPGAGKLLHLREPVSGRGYCLYLPRQYSTESADLPSGKLWPLVVTLHGMKPFDNHRAQISEWQQQADAYGFIVCAPSLHTSDVLMELPLRNVRPYVKHDEQAILAIMDQVYRITDVDPNNVLITSWSSGGYLAHYLLNRHPDRFTCLAVRQSNFSVSILDPGQIYKYRDTPIAIFFGQNDFAICRTESREAVSWYRAHGFDVEAFSVEGLGHERTPETAANYFARVCQRQPLDRALAQQALARVRIQPVMALTTTSAQVPSGSAGKLRSAASVPSSGPLALAHAGQLPGGGQIEPYLAPRVRSGRSATAAPEAGQQASSGINIALSSPGGIAPVYLRFRLESSERLPAGADCLWLHNGEPICSGLGGTKILHTPGQHHIEALITNPSGRQFRARRTVIVQPKMPLASR
jgi:poly(3-hydroxybutyrate) depolymerase